MSTNKATGMDSLSIKLVKLSAPLITHAMTVIFNKSIVSGTFPCEWKISIYVNDLPNCLKHTRCNTFADDTQIDTSSNNIESIANILNEDLKTFLIG